MLPADFFKINVFKKIFRNAISDRLDPDQARHFVGPDLGPNCLQILSADNTSRYRGIDEILKSVAFKVNNYSRMIESIIINIVQVVFVLVINENNITN